MNPLPGKNEWDSAKSTTLAGLSGKSEEKSAELRLSGTHTQQLPILNAASQFGAKLVQFAVKPMAERESRSPVISKKVLAAMEGDPDPAASLAGIRNLLVGPTRNLHNAMFEEVVTILEESDREVQQALRSLGRKFESLSHVTDELVSASLEGKDEGRQQSEHFQKELQKSASSQQEMLSEMFLVIDAKIEDLTMQVDTKIRALTEKMEADMREAIAQQDRKIRELEARCLANTNKGAEDLEARLERLEKRSNTEKDDLSEAFAGGLSSIAERLKAMRAS